MERGDYAMIPDDELMKYARYLARRQSWVLQYRSDYSIEDLEVMAAMAILEAEYHDGTSTRKWVYTAPLYFKKQLREELCLYREPGRFAMACTSNKLQLDAPIGDDEDMTAAEAVPDPDAQSPEDAAISSSLSGAVWAALDELDEDIERDCIIMHYMHRVSIKEIAEAAGIDRQEVCNAIARGKLQLRYNHKLRAMVEAGLDEMTPFYSGTGRGAWERSGMSVQERLTIWRDQKRQKLQYNAPHDAQEVANV